MAIQALNTGNCAYMYGNVGLNCDNKLATVWLIIFVGFKFLWILWVLSTKITEF